MMSVLPTSVKKKVRIQALSDKSCQIWLTAVAENFIFQTLLRNSDFYPSLKVKATEQSVHDRKNIANESQVKYCDIQRDM